VNARWKARWILPLHRPRWKLAIWNTPTIGRFETCRLCGAEKDRHTWGSGWPAVEPQRESEDEKRRRISRLGLIPLAVFKVKPGEITNIERFERTTDHHA